MQLTTLLAIITFVTGVIASPAATTTYKPKDRPKPRPTDLAECHRYKSSCTFYSDIETCCHQYKCSEFSSTCIVNCLEHPC
ncbi:hypothetical protein ANO14919_136170 [Xylariales sp. No.14919]|nr:hypothetical protein ANO14919_136170 [Xylariales sp. No.14919]